VIVGAGGGSTAEVGGEPSDNVVMEVSLGYFEKELVMGNAVEGFGEINGHSCGPSWRLRFIETFSNGRRQWQESRCCGVGGFETMLCGMCRQGSNKEWE